MTEGREVRRQPLAKRLAASLRRRVLQEVERLGLTHAEVAVRLGLLPVGVEMLFARNEWPLETAAGVAEAFALKVDFRIWAEDEPDSPDARHLLATRALDGDADALVALVEESVRGRLDAADTFAKSVAGSMGRLFASLESLGIGAPLPRESEGPEG